MLIISMQQLMSGVLSQGCTSFGTMRQLHSLGVTTAIALGPQKAWLSASCSSRGSIPGLNDMTRQADRVSGGSQAEAPEAAMGSPALKHPVQGFATLVLHTAPTSVSCPQSSRLSVHPSFQAKTVWQAAAVTAPGECPAQGADAGPMTTRTRCSLGRSRRSGRARGSWQQSSERAG